MTSTMVSKKFKIPSKSKNDDLDGTEGVTNDHSLSAPDSNRTDDGSVDDQLFEEVYNSLMARVQRIPYDEPILEGNSVDNFNDGVCDILHLEESLVEEIIADTATVSSQMEAVKSTTSRGTQTLSTVAMKNAQMQTENHSDDDDDVVFIDIVRNAGTNPSQRKSVKDRVECFEDVKGGRSRKKKRKTKEATPGTVSAQTISSTSQIQIHHTKRLNPSSERSNTVSNSNARAGSAVSPSQNSPDEPTTIWLQCDACDKWRLVPAAMVTPLPETWNCGQGAGVANDVDPCSAPEVGISPNDAAEWIIVTRREGDVVYAKMRGYPFWPAMVERLDHAQAVYVRRDDLGRVTGYHVTFFDDPPSKAWIDVDNIRPYPSDEVETSRINNKPTTKRSWMWPLKKRFEAGERAAALALEIVDPEERLRRFGYDALLASSRRLTTASSSKKRGRSAVVAAAKQCASEGSARRKSFSGRTIRSPRRGDSNRSLASVPSAENLTGQRGPKRSASTTSDTDDEALAPRRKGQRLKAKTFGKSCGKRKERKADSRRTENATEPGGGPAHRSRCVKTGGASSPTPLELVHEVVLEGEDDDAVSYVDEAGLKRFASESEVDSNFSFDFEMPLSRGPSQPDLVNGTLK